MNQYHRSVNQNKCVIVVTWLNIDIHWYAWTRQEICSEANFKYRTTPCYITLWIADVTKAAKVMHIKWLQMNCYFIMFVL